MQEASLGPTHAGVAGTLSAIGLLNRREGRLPEARDALQRALAIREQALGREHPDMAALLNNLALTTQTLGDLAAARALFERALAIHERHRGAEHPFVGGTLSNLGNVVRQMGDAAAARPLLERALVINEKAYGPDHQTIATDTNALGMALTRLDRYDEAKRFQEAERLLLDGYRILRQQYGPAAEDTVAAARDLARLYEAWGCPADAARYRVPSQERANTSSDQASGTDTAGSPRPR